MYTRVAVMPGTLALQARGAALIKGFHVTMMRPPTAPTIAGWTGSNAVLLLAKASGLRTTLSVTNTASPSQPVTDFQAYANTLVQILGTYPPAILFVENEENSALFYAGTPVQYGNTLITARVTAHALGIPVSNGGLVSTLVAWLVYDNYILTNQPAKAASFAARALTQEQLDQYNSGAADAQIAKGKQLLAIYTQAAIDFVNFHWYIADIEAMREAKDYLEAQTGLPAVTNEIGQLTLDAADTHTILSGALALNMPYVTWFGFDAAQAIGLCDTSGVLNENGIEFRHHMAGVRQNFFRRGHMNSTQFFP